MNTTLNHATQYLRAGWSVIPLRPKSKEPLIQWRPFAQRLPTLELLSQWFGDAANANIGIVTGGVSKIIVVDVDSLEGLSYARTHNLISPVCVVTGKGKHYYFKHPGGEVGNTIKSLPGIDTRGDGGYVMAPPSIHPTGRRYSWASGAFLSGCKLPEFPTELFEKEDQSNKQGWISDALASLTEGNRNDTFTRIVGRLHRDKWAASDIYNLLRAHAETANFPISELDCIIQSVTRYRDGQFLGSQSEDEEVSIHTFTNMDEYNKRRATRSRGIELPTGYPKLDRLCGGLQRGELLTVAARTGVGKTNFVVRASEHLCERGRSVLYLSTEMSFDRIWERYIAVTPVGADYKQHQFFVCDDFIPSIEKVERAIQKVMPDVVVFDHINHVGDEQQRLSEFMKELKKLSRRYDIPGIVTAQLNRQADWIDPQTHEKVIPRLSMIKGSGTIEQASAQVLLLSEVAIGPDQNEIIGNLDKNRYGEKDIIPFVLKKNPYRMEELDGVS